MRDNSTHTHTRREMGTLRETTPKAMAATAQNARVRNRFYFIFEREPKVHGRRIPAPMINGMHTNNGKNGLKVGKMPFIFIKEK